MQLQLRKLTLVVGFAVGLGASTVFLGPAGIAQTSLNATTETKGKTFYDRYMVAGYDATKRRDHETALVYFKRALDERPDDTYATQAIRNVEGYLGKKPGGPVVTVPTSPVAGTPDQPVPPPKASPKPAPSPKTAPKPAPSPTAGTKPAATKTPSKPVSTTQAKAPGTQPANNSTPNKLTPPKAPPSSQAVAPTVKPPSAVVVVPAAPPSDAFSEQQAIELISRWLQAKADVFAPPYDQQQVVDLTTGELLASLVRPNGVLDWLKINRAYFRYGVQKVDSVERFAVARDRATMEVMLTEDRTLYLNGAIDPDRTDFSSQKVRFTFVLDNDTWKIADYKTVNGLLLERSILSSASSPIGQ